MRTRRSGLRRWTLPTSTSEVAPNLPVNVRILGLDPGSIVTGYALIECSNGVTRYLASGGIRTSGENFPERLATIFRSAAELAREWRPNEVAIERVFMHRNADSALKLGQARGAALCGVFSETAQIFEYSPREVKQAVVGTGAAQKEQVQLMVKHLLKLSGELKADAADAVAIALCHANSRSLRHMMMRSRLSEVAR